MTTLLLILGWLVIALGLAGVAIILALICAAGTMRCNRCHGWHDGGCPNDGEGV